jgi:hypothetical protein
MFGTPQFCVTQLGCGVVGARGAGTTLFGVGDAADGLRKAGLPPVGAFSAGALVWSPPAVPGDAVLGDVVPAAPDAPPVPLVPPVCGQAAPDAPSSTQTPSAMRETNETMTLPPMIGWAKFVRGNVPAHDAFPSRDHAGMSVTEPRPPLAVGPNAVPPPFFGGDPAMHSQPQKRTLEGFGAQRGAHGFIIHIIDDRGEVFEIDVSEANLTTIVRELEVLVAGDTDIDEDTEPRAQAS